MAPLTSAAVTIAKPSWKVANNSSGTGPRAVSGLMPSIPMWERLPTRPATPSLENAMVYPTISHATVTNGIEMKLIMIMLSTPVVRTMPP